MPQSELRWFKARADLIERDRVLEIPRGRRGIYVLFRASERRGRYHVVYVGMTGGPNAGMRSRLRRHHRRFGKSAWTHFSLFEVWDNVTGSEVRELEGLLLHIFRLDPNGLPGNRQRDFRPLKRLPMLLRKSSKGRSKDEE